MNPFYWVKMNGVQTDGPECSFFAENGNHW